MNALKHLISLQVLGETLEDYEQVVEIVKDLDGFKVFERTSRTVPFITYKGVLIVLNKLRNDNNFKILATVHIKFNTTKLPVDYTKGDNRKILIAPSDLNQDIESLIRSIRAIDEELNNHPNITIDMGTERYD